METLHLGAHQKNLSFALSSWEVLDLFDFLKWGSHEMMVYDPAVREVKLFRRGLYQFEFKSSLITDTEEMIYIKFRLNIDGVTSMEHLCNTGTDQKWMQQITIAEDSVIIIEVFATPNDGTPVISNDGNDYLIVTKLI